MHYVSNYVHGCAELDSYTDGCQASGGFDRSFGYTFSAPTQAEFIGQVCDFFGVQRDGIDINACDEPGRIDVCKMENADGEEPTERERAAWKRGKLELWYVTYTVYAKQVERAPAVFA